MSQSFSRDHLKLSLARILQTLGWNSINSTPLEILTDVMENFMKQISRATVNYSNEFGCTHPNLDHVNLALREMNVNVSELEEYVKYVNYGPPSVAVPRYPRPKEDHLNFLKPGSKEVITRPVHIHEYLPPMYPLLESQDGDATAVGCDESGEDAAIFKKPADISMQDQRKLKEEESSRPTREISSVMMTTSGFLSPAREGRLPEARTPITPPDPPTPPPSLPPPTPPTPSPPTATSPSPSVHHKEPKDSQKSTQSQQSTPSHLSPHPTKFTSPKRDSIEIPTTSSKKSAGKVKKTEKKKHQSGIAKLFTPDEKKRKTGSMKWFIKQQQQQQLQQEQINQINSIHSTSIGGTNGGGKSTAETAVTPSKPAKMSALAAARLKTEKLNTTITPIPMNTNTEPDTVDKLFNEPDKKKMNIFKKISNVKNEKNSENKSSKKDSFTSKMPSESVDMERPVQSSDEFVAKLPHLPSDVTIEPINNTNSAVLPPSTAIRNSLAPDEMCFDDFRTQTPKTPEICTPNSPAIKEKRRRKENKKMKKMQKQSPQRLIDNEIIDVNMERPKTPEVLQKLDLPSMLNPLQQMGPLPFPFLTNFGGPGLIPTALGNPLMTPLGLQSMNLPPHFGQHYFPSSPSGLPSTPRPRSPSSVKTPTIFTPFQSSSNLLQSPPTISPSQHQQQQQQQQQEQQSSMDVSKDFHSSEPSGFSSPKNQLSVASSDPSLVSPKQSKDDGSESSPVVEKPKKKDKEHKKDKKDKIKKKNKKDKQKDKILKKKLKENKKERLKKEKKEKRKGKEAPTDGESPINMKIRLKIKSPSPRPNTPDTLKLNIKPILKKDETPSRSEVCEEATGLAKISALVCGPPKPKSTPSASTDSSQPNTSSDNYVNETKKNMFRAIPKIRTKELRRESVVNDLPSTQPLSFSYIDEKGNTIWICPACRKQDDGTPMIGCDCCDAWYHWVCVGIQVPPDDKVNWYCRMCLLKKNEDLQTDKQKKKRKKKEKKEH